MKIFGFVPDQTWARKITIHKKSEEAKLDHPFPLDYL